MPRMTMTTRSSMRVKPSSEFRRVLMRSNMVLGLLCATTEWNAMFLATVIGAKGAQRFPQKGETACVRLTLVVRAGEDERDEIVDLRRCQAGAAVRRHRGAPGTGLRDVRARIGDRL